MSIGAGYNGPVLFGGIDGGTPISFSTIDSAAIRGKATVGDRVDYAGEEYVFVHNAGATDASVGMAMVLSSLSGLSLTISSLSGYDTPMVVVKHATIVAGGFGYGLVRGFTQVRTESTMATGAWITLGDDGIFKTFIGSSNTDVVQGEQVGKIVSSGTGSNSSMPKAYVKCFG